jgi:hypothetical protein
LDRRLGWPQNCSRCNGEKKNSQPSPGIEPSMTRVYNFGEHDDDDDDVDINRA